MASAGMTAHHGATLASVVDGSTRTAQAANGTSGRIAAATSTARTSPR